MRRLALVAAVLAGLGLGSAAHAEEEVVLAPIASGQPPPRPVPPPPNARTPAIIASAATGVLFVATIGSYVRHQHFVELMRQDTLVINDENDMVGKAHYEHQNAAFRWQHIAIGVGVTTLVSAGLTGYLWSRATDKSFSRAHAVTVAPSASGGATLALSGAF